MALEHCSCPMTLLAQRKVFSKAHYLHFHSHSSRLEKRVQKGPEFDDVIQSLKDQGLVRNEGTELYYNLADEFISRRCDEGTCLVDKICGNSRSRRRPTTRIKIESLGIEPTTPTAVGSWSSPSAGQHLDRAGVPMPQGVLQNIACENRGLPRIQDIQEPGQFSQTSTQETAGQHHDTPMDDFHRTMKPEVIGFRSVVEESSLEVLGVVGF
ncbi:hypothetical protein N8I77_013362 [Diaporthe amygdali]|uniref:Uncharacterized protein n=1 Tax=Phomopsis amygdali TaxID=1214568 RepID=A0AAD9S1A3_PHOAM|nr:hypothetical protein N8I77_013362 [Diaporthe amygdali]